MSIDITDIRIVRRNALQNIRRAMYREGYAFSSSPEIFPTGKGMSQPELNALYEYYESYYGHVELEDVTLFEYSNDEEYEYEEYSEEYDEPTISFIELARERIASLDFPQILNHFNDIISQAIHIANEYGNGIVAVEHYLAGEGASDFDDLYADLYYIVRNADKYGEHSTIYLANLRLEEFRGNIYRYLS